MADNTYPSTGAFVAPHETEAAENVAREVYQKRLEKARQNSLTFNGVKYQNKQQVDAAKQQFKALAYADYLSVGGDMNAFKLQKESKSGLRWMSPDEQNYIAKLHSENTSPTKYTKSAEDKYLQSIGLPSAKDLTKYRSKYTEYVGPGGIKAVYGDISEDEAKFIRDKFQADTIVGLDGNRYNSNGKALKYADTLLDTELRANGLPNSEEMNVYHAAYLEEKKAKLEEEKAKQDFAEKKQSFYDHVMELEERGMDAQSAWYRALSEPEYASLTDRVMEPALDPDRDDANYDAKMLKAVEQNNKFKAAEDTRISRLDYSRYAIKKEREQNEEKRAAQQQEKMAAAQTAMITPAYTKEEKEAQAQAIADYITAYDLKNEDGSPISVSDFNGYLSLINLGVPADVIEESYTNGLPALIKWNDEKNKGDFRKWSEIRMALDGISPQDGDYDTVRDLMTRTHIAMMSSDYGTASQYDPLLFAKEQDMSRSTSRSNAVSVNGALYAMVNGQESGTIVDATPAQREMVRDLTEKDSYTDKSLLDYLSEDERGAFNSMFRESPSQAYRYLDDLQTVLEKRAENEMLNRYLFANSKQESEDTAYELNMRNVDAEMSSRKPGQTNYWEAEAWEKYRDYSDDALQRITDENLAIIADQSASTSTEEKMEAQLNLQDIQFVLDQRTKARDSASLSSALFGYTDQDGQNATDTVKRNIGRYDDSRYARLVNGLVEENELAGGDYTNVGSGTMTIDLGGLKSYETDELAPVIAEMTDEQRKQFNYILVNDGAEAADAYIGQIWRGIDTAAKNKVRAEQAGMVDDSFGGGLAASVEKVFWLPYSGLMSATGTALNKALDLDISQTQAARWDLGGGVQSAISQNISDSIENDSLASVANFFYNVGMSSAESSLGGLLSRGMPFVGEFALAGSAYTSTLASSLEKGLSQEQAVQTATTAAMVEWITEHMGIDGVTKGLEKAAERGVTNGWKWWQNALAQAGIQFLPEALEEGAGSVMNTAFDLIINKDKAELVEAYNDAIARGYSPEEATRLAAVEFAKDTGLEMLAGGLAGSGTVVSGAVTQLAQAAPQVGMKVALDTLGRYAYGDQARARRGHSNVFSEGRGIIDTLYGTEHGDLIQTYLDQRETVGDKKGIDSVAGILKNVSKESDLYDILYDSNGNSKLSDAEQAALASMLYLDGAEADLDSIEATYIAEQAGKQTERERSANTNHDAIKSAVEVRNVKNQMNATRTAMENATADFEAKYQTDLDSANAKLADAKSRQAGLLSKLRAAQGDSKAQTKLFDSLSAVNTEITNLQASVDSASEKMESARRNLEAANTGRQHEIDRMQHILDVHYASADNLIKTATGNKRTLEMQAAASRRRVKELGAVLDQLLEGEFADASDSAWVESVQDDLTQARDELQRLERFANRQSFSTVSEALGAIKSGNAKSIVDRINSASQNAVSASADADSSAPETNNEAQTGNLSSSEETSEKPRRNAPQETFTKKTFNISKTTQERFSRIAKRFGCEVVWQTSAEIGGNGKYDPQNPNKIYLATDMLANRNLPTDMVVAKEFFTHEIVHYVANTRTYQSLSVLAERYYTDNGFDYEQLIQDRIAEEKEQYGRDISRETAREELTAVFAQDVLFAEENGASLNWVAKADGTVVRNFLTTVEYLIKRGNVRRMKDGSAVKTLLLDSEYALAKAIGERKALDNAGLSSAFSVPTAGRTEQAQAQSEEAPSEPESVEETPAEETQTEEETPVEQTAEETPVLEETPTEEAPAEETPVEENTAEEEVAEPAHVAEETEVSEPSPVEETVEETQQEAPTEEVSETPAPVEETETAPVEESVAEPVQETAEEAQPVQEETAQPVQEETPVQETRPAEEISTHPSGDNMVSIVGYNSSNANNPTRVAGRYNTTNDITSMLPGARYATGNAVVNYKDFATTANHYLYRYRGGDNGLGNSRVFTCFSQNGQLVFGSEQNGNKQINIANPKGIGNSFIDDVIDFPYLSDAESKQAGSYGEAEIFGRPRNTAGSDIQFTDAQKAQFKKIANALQKGDTIALHLPQSGDYEALSLQVLREIFKDIPANQRAEIGFATGVDEDFAEESYLWARPRLLLTSPGVTDNVRSAKYNTSFGKRGIEVRNLTMSPVSAEQSSTPKESIKDIRAEMNSTSTGEVRYSRGESIADMRQAYGIKKQNEYGRSNNIVTPARTSENNRVSDVAQTLKEIPGISQEARDSIDDILAEARTELEHGGLVYKPVTMEDMRKQGQDYITKAGSLYQAMHDLSVQIQNAQIKDLQKLEAAAAIVFEEIAHTEDSAVFASPEYADFVSAIGMMNSQWGRMGKAMQLMKDSPLGRRKYMEKVVEHINAENEQVMSKFLNRTLNRKNVGKTIDISESLYRDLEAARTPAEIRAAEYRISEEIGRQSPLTIEDAIRNWRYFSMLGNFVTHERNMLGNFSMLGMRTAKDVVAAGLEALATKTGLMKQEERTHSLKSTKEITEYAKQLFTENAETVQGNSKYDVRSKMKDAVKKSPFKAIDSLIRLNSNALEMEDKLFLYATYVSAAKSYMSAQGIDPSNITAEQKANINAYATQQAQEATYRDASKIADMLNSLSKVPYFGALMEAVMPFKKTPVNIARRGLEYSPASLIKGVVDIVRYARKNGNKVPASKICDELGKGIVGSALTLLGIWLAKSGILKLKAGDDDRAEALGKDFGHQDYSLEIGDYSIKIESIAPMTFPLFAGAAFYDSRKKGENRDGEMNWNNVLNSMFEAVSTISDPLMDMSFMSSLNSALSSYSDNTIGGIATNALTSYVSQFAPTLFGKINQTVTPTRRTTKSAASAKDVVPGGGTFDYALRSLASKIPGGTALLEPYVKLTGEYDKKDSAAEYALAVMNNFLSPVNVQRIDTTPVAEELSRVIAATGNTEFVPRNPQKYFRANKQNYNLTAKEYTEYSKDHNETVYAMLSDVINSRDYQRADDDEKVDMLKKAYTTAHSTMQKKWKAIILEKRGVKSGANDEGEE